MQMPLSFSSKFIGKVVALRDSCERGSAAWHLLCIAVDQMREFNRNPDNRTALWPYMLRTRSELRAHSVMVG